MKYIGRQVSCIPEGELDNFESNSTSRLLDANCFTLRDLEMGSKYICINVSAYE